jgi:hypothetical protein
VYKILKTGWLTYPPHDPSRPRSLSVDFSKPISTDEALRYEVVCFYVAAFVFTRFGGTPIGV